MFWPESAARVGKERGMRRRLLKAYWKRLAELRAQNNTRDALLKKIGAAQQKAGRVVSKWRLLRYPKKDD